MGRQHQADHRKHDLLGQHLRSIGRIPLLTAAEEINLARMVQRGRALEALSETLEERTAQGLIATEALALKAGITIQELKRQLKAAKRAKERMINANLRLVVTIAKRYGNSLLELDDLIQEGNLGLIKAVDRYDPTRGYKFSTYAYWWIRESITRGLAKHGRTIRLPAHIIEILIKLQKSQRLLNQKLKRNPTLHEIAEDTGCSLTEVREVLQSAQAPISFDSKTGENDDQQLLDLIASNLDPTDAPTILELMKRDVRKALNQLTKPEKDLLMMRHGIECTDELSLSAAARKIGITRDSARGIERRASQSIAKSSSHMRDYIFP